MSVLSFPRIYFKGFMEWDPCTFNNNDWQAFQTYDPANAALNWPFLATQAITPVNPQGITPDNFTTTFRPWAIALQDDTNPNDNPPNGPAGKRIPAEWNMFGGHGVSFTQYGDYTTTIIGGDLGHGQPVTSDPLIGGPVNINGDSGNGPGRLVDTNPASFWSSQIYLGQLSLGGANCIISGPPSVRLHSRWLNLNRIYTEDQALTQPAAGVACCFQAGIPSSEITWPSASANSPLASALQKAASKSPAQGIMVRFTAYVNLYFKNGVFNNISTQPGNYEELASVLATAWDTWNNSGGKDFSKFFSNPCYSHIVGVVGLWNEGEVATVPGGRYLSALNPVAPPRQADALPPLNPRQYSLGHHVMLGKTQDAAPFSTLLGPLVAHVDYDAQLISLDLNSTIPENGTPGEWPSDLSKTDFGPLTLGVLEAGTFTQIAEIVSTQYGQTPYEASAGIIDIPFPNPETGKLLQSGTLAIEVQGQTALLEQSYTAQTDSRGIYLDENGQGEFDITVCRMGVPSPGAGVLIAKYDETLSLISTDAPQLVNFTNGNRTTVTIGGVSTVVTVFTADENGIASVGIEAQSPGFPVLAFFPYTGDTLPQPPAALLGPAGPLITSAFYATVRVLPFDAELPGKFIDLWNATVDPEQAWEFIYNNVLYVYDMLFSVMLVYVNLGSRSAVEANIGGIWDMISDASAQDSTLAMPVTRDMSAGKRLALQLWIYLVANNYIVLEPGLPVPSDATQGSNKMTLDSIPAGWAPPG
jgi:hypothetical protein